MGNHTGRVTAHASAHDDYDPDVPAGREMSDLGSDFDVPGAFDDMPVTSSVEDEAEVPRHNRDTLRDDDSRPYRRTVFTLEDWARHRSTWRYVRHLKSLPMSGIVRACLPLCLFYCADGALVMCFDTLQRAGTIPAVVPDLSSVPFSLSGFALSLLLVFRTNSGYERFDQARKVTRETGGCHCRMHRTACLVQRSSPPWPQYWGLMVNRCRDLVRQCVTYMPRHEGGTERALECARLVKALPRAAMAQLRGMPSDDLADLLVGAGLSKREAAVVAASDHPFNFLLEAISEIVSESRLDPQIKLAIDANLTSFADQIGGCERILRTPVPLFYSHHISRFMTIWLALLPLG